MSKHFKNEIKNVLIEKISTKIKPPHFLPLVFLYLLWVFRGIPLPALLPSFLLRWENLINHPTMTIKIWIFLACRLFSRNPGNILGTLKVNVKNVVYFFVIYRLYLNYDPKLIAELQVINLRHKILQHCNFNTDHLSENFLSRKEKNFKGSLM